MPAGNRMRRALIWTLLAVAVIPAPLVTILTGQAGGKPSPEVAAVLVRSYLQYRLEITGRAPIVRFCGRFARQVSAMDRGQMEADGLITSSDTTCADDRPSPAMIRQVTTLQIEGATMGDSVVSLKAAQLLERCSYVPEVAVLAQRGYWQLESITFGRPSLSTGSCIPYTTRSDRPSS